MDKIKTVLRYPGAKRRIAVQIVSMLPKHNVYVEPYAGSLAVLFQKKPCRIETVNDINGDIVNFFRVLRDNQGELQRRIALTPYGREEYEGCFRPTEDGIERARRFCVRCWMGRGASTQYKNGFKNVRKSVASNPAIIWDGLPQTIVAAAKRLKRVQIENRPALDVIRDYRSAETCMYVDPPYLPGTRRNNLYRDEMSYGDHEELLKELVSHPGKVILSGYRSGLYDDYLRGWYRRDVETYGDSGTKKTEVIWTNFEPAYRQLSFDDCFPENATT